MDDIGGLPFAKLHLDKDGEIVSRPDKLFPVGTTDAIVISHGWKNDEDDANDLYRELLTNVVTKAGGTLDPAKSFAVLGIYWPAFRYNEDLSIVKDDLGVDDRGGGRAVASAEIDPTALRARAAALAAELGIGDPAAFADRAFDAKGGGGAADQLLNELRAALVDDADEEARADHRMLLHTPGRELVETLKQGASFDTVDPDGSASADRGSAQGIGKAAGRIAASMLTGGKAAIASILNQVTYYEMKARAGAIGKALAALLGDDLPDGVRLHLIGHSFGARLVTSVAARLPTGRVASLSLLQGAYSHNGLGLEIGPDHVRGGFRDVIERRVVEGPILVTHTHRDTAVGFFYAVASLASGEIAKGLGRLVEKIVGGPKDLHGGLGANGAQHLKDGEWVDVQAARAMIEGLKPGVVNNVQSDAIVSQHWDVRNPDVATLVWHAIR